MSNTLIAKSRESNGKLLVYMQWPGSGNCDVDGHQIYYTDENRLQHRNGVAIIFNNKVDKDVLGSIPISDRVIIVKLDAKQCRLNVIQTYAPIRIVLKKS